eukprot:4788879-Prymnesium_polylepis.1
MHGAWFALGGDGVVWAHGAWLCACVFACVLGAHAGACFLRTAASFFSAVARCASAAATAACALSFFSLGFALGAPNPSDAR